jgi:hypothetical protein
MSTKGHHGDDSLKPEGFSGHDRYEKGIAPIQPLTLTPGMTLSTLSEEYVFFNHGALFSYGEMRIDPAEEYIAEHRTPLRLVLSPDTLFEGLSNGDKEFQAWEHALVLVPKADWQGMASILLQTAIVNRDTKSLFRPYARELLIHDWLQSSIATSAAQISAVLFGLDGNKSYIGFEEKAGRMCVQRARPRRETIRFAKKLLRGHNPYDDLEPT